MGMIVMKINASMQKYLPIIIFIGLSLSVVWFNPAFGEAPKKEVKYEAGFYYTIKKGDTLWDISQRFNDTPWQWPDLWKENEQIPNPHWIYPGERIRLFRKSDKHRYQEQMKMKSAPTVTPQVAAQQPAAEPEVHFIYNRMSRIGFIRKPAVQPLGQIFSVIDNKKLISAGDVVYISPPSNGPAHEFAPGSRFTVYRTLKPTPERRSEKVIGTQHLLLGVVEVTQIEPQYAIAKVIDTFRAINPGDLLMAYQERSPEIIVADSTPNIKGKLIGTEEHTKLIGTGMVAFIDKGEVDNIRRGQQYTIYYQETKEKVNGKESVTLAPVEIGSLVVLHIEKTTSTVFITDASGKITPGEKIRTP
jgi:hypothetical protein